ncbi:MAG TPA: enoyl-CoA hydratase/isomerase family protein [Isosphaeraceae bacterium]|jgi:methylglutaconyl-CoA hydratase
MNERLVLRDDRGPIVVLTLNRPERRNALARGLVTALSDALDRLMVELGPRVVVLTGAGAAFCAGMDLKEAIQRGEHDAAEAEAVTDVQGFADLINQLHRFPRPTIAALNGDALAGGAGLAIACDFVLAAAEARIGYPEVLRGLAPAVVMQDLVRQLGDRRARELVLTGRPIPADQAERWGLINRVVPAGSVLAEALELARSLLESGPRAIATSKQLLDEATNRPADLRGAAAISASVRVTDEAREGMRSFLEKRPPSWTSAAPPARLEDGQSRDPGSDPSQPMNAINPSPPQDFGEM